MALAWLLVEERRPGTGFRHDVLISSRLLENEVWCRLHAHGLSAPHGSAARELLARITLIEASPPVLTRALRPFPQRVRTLDALHLASLEFLRGRRPEPALTSYGKRMVGLGLAIAGLAA